MAALAADLTNYANTYAVNSLVELQASKVCMNDAVNYFGTQVSHFLPRLSKIKVAGSDVAGSTTYISCCTLDGHLADCSIAGATKDCMAKGYSF